MQLQIVHLVCDKCPEVVSGPVEKNVQATMARHQAKKHSETSKRRGKNE